MSQLVITTSFERVIRMLRRCGTGVIFTGSRGFFPASELPAPALIDYCPPLPLLSPVTFYRMDFSVVGHKTNNGGGTAAAESSRSLSGAGLTV